MYLNHLTDRELIRHAEASLDPMFSSDLERELLKRLSRTVHAVKLDGDNEVITRQIHNHLVTILNDQPRGMSDTKVSDAVSEIERLVRDLGDDE